MKQEEVIKAVAGGDLKFLKNLFTDDPAWLTSPLDSLQRLAIHHASYCGQLGVVKLLLSCKPDLVNCLDVMGSTPLILSTRARHNEVVAYLLSHNANLEVCDNSGRTALIYAMCNSDYELTNTLLLKKFEQSASEMICFISTPQQVIDLMTRAPALIEDLLANQSLVALMERSAECELTTDMVSWYQPKDKRDSCLITIDRKTGRSRKFKESQNLGQGCNGVVRAFVDDENQLIAVKSPKKSYLNITENKKKDLREDLEYEERALRRAYADDFSAYFEFNMHRHNGISYTNRLIMPHFKGQTLKALRGTLSSENAVAVLFLAVAQELQRLHDLFLIHGDIKEDNIIVDSGPDGFQIRFIDFGLSYFLTDRNACNCTGEPWEFPYLPPERVSLNDINILKPHPNQDVFSLGYCFLEHLKDDIKKRAALLNSFPVIKEFISAARQTDPSVRPSLPVFCTQLLKEIDKSSSVNPQIQATPLATLFQFWIRPNTSKETVKSGMIHQISQP